MAMFRRALVGVDGRDGGRDAIALAKRILSPRSVLTLGYVLTGEAYVWPEAPGYSDSERDEALAILKQAREDSGLSADVSVIGCPSVARGLHELARKTRADVLILGSSRRGPLGTLVLGDDARAALRDAPCPVAIAPTAYAREADPVAEVGVAYDGSQESERALTLARELADQHNARLSAFEAVSLPAAAYLSGAPPEADVYDDMVTEATAQVAALGGVEPHAVYGQTTEELAQYSASVDVLVVGSRDLGFPGRLFSRSVSRQLARSARCPLIVVPRKARPS